MRFLLLLLALAACGDNIDYGTMRPVMQAIGDAAEARAEVCGFPEASISERVVQIACGRQDCDSPLVKPVDLERCLDDISIWPCEIREFPVSCWYGFTWPTERNAHVRK